MIPIFEHRRVVVPGDIDEMGHANNLVYMHWAIDAAVHHSRANGWDFERYKTIGAGWVVRNHTITYLRPALEGDAIIVRTWISDLARATCRRMYQIDRESSRGVERLAAASTDWVFIDFQKQGPKRIPQEVIDSFTVVSDAPP